MVMNWAQQLDKGVEAIGTLLKENPKLLEGLQALGAAERTKGALDDKTRELISLAVAATTRCDTCISVHVQQAIKAGATRDELLEALAVAINLNAGAALVYSSRALNAFDQFTKP